MCGKYQPKDKKVRLFNSTLKADPSKKPKKTPVKKFKSGRISRAGSMKEYIQYRYPGYVSGPVPCDNCGKMIDIIRFENVSHIKSRATRPDLMHDFENMELICGPNQYQGKVDDSCHTNWHNNKKRYLEKKK